MSNETLQDKRQKAEDTVQPVTAPLEHADATGADISCTGFDISIPMPSIPPATLVSVVH
jgi:hypothetical protein